VPCADSERLSFGESLPLDASRGHAGEFLEQNSAGGVMAKFIYLFAKILSSWQGFLATFIVLLIGIAIGAALQFNEAFMFGFNIFLSVAAIVISGIILVAGARSEAAIHVKLDYLIEYSKATNKAVGIEHKDFKEIEKARKAVEEEVEQELEGAVEVEVSERLTPR
jgi:low affinity Fe/Cu permease